MIIVGGMPSFGTSSTPGAPWTDSSDILKKGSLSLFRTQRILHTLPNPLHLHHGYFEISGGTS